jgi:hypothetical protein
MILFFIMIKLKPSTAMYELADCIDDIYNLQSKIKILFIARFYITIYGYSILSIPCFLWLKLSLPHGHLEL